MKLGASLLSFSVALAGAVVAGTGTVRESVRHLLKDDFAVLNAGQCSLKEFGDRVLAHAEKSPPEMQDVMWAGAVRIFSRAGDTNGLVVASNRLDALRRPFVKQGDEAVLRLGRFGEIAFAACPTGTVELVLNSAGTKSVRVALTRPFWIMKYPITRRQASLYPPLNPIDGTVSEKTFADYVSLNRSMAEGLARHFTERFRDKLPTGYAFRLATLAEWEFAFHANTGDEKNPFFDLKHIHRNDETDRAIYYDYDRLEPRRRKRANDWGIGDWCRHEKVWDTFDARELVQGMKDNDSFYLVEELPMPRSVNNPVWACTSSNAVSILRQPSWVRWKASTLDYGQDWCPARFVIAPEIR